MKQNLKALAREYKADPWATHIAIHDMSEEHNCVTLRQCVYEPNGELYLDNPAGEGNPVNQIIGFEFVEIASSQMTRPVTIFEWWRPEDSALSTPFKKRELGKGNFHQFGNDVFEEQDSVATFSTAIVEMPDGTVKNVEVEMIRFDD